MQPRRFKYAPPAFLRTEEAAVRWANRNVDHGNDREQLDELAEAYSYFARESYRKAHLGQPITVYRMVRVPVVNGVAAVDVNCLGKAWSATQGGAGVYGSVAHHGVNLADVIIEGRVMPEHVDWEYGYTSFLYYGESQWEVSLLTDSPVEVVKINGGELVPHVDGSTGPAGEMWQNLCGNQART
jgi:hypothetical protein